LPTAIERFTGIGWKEQKSALLVGLGHAGTHWIVATLYLILPFVAKDLGLSYSEVGFLVAALHVSSASANFGSGLVVDLTGRKVVFLLLSLLIGGSAFSVFALGPSFPVLVLMVVFIGGSTNLWHPAAISFLSQLYPAHKGYALSLHVLGASLADSLAPLVAGFLIAALAWQGTAALGAVPAFLAALLTAAVLLRRDRPSDPGSRRVVGFRDYLAGLKELVSDKAILSLCLMSGFRNMTITGLYVFLPLYLADVMGISPIWMGASMTALQVGAIFGTPIAGIASDRMSRRTIMMAGLSFSTVVLLALTVVENNAIFIGGVSMLGFVLFSVRPVIQSWLMDLTPPRVGASATSLLFGIQSTLSTLAPAIGGMMADAWGLRSVFLMLGGTILAANLLTFILPKEDAARR
jgi:predicted MFS family arabinose efflux permease